MNPVLSNMNGAGQAKTESGPFYYLYRLFPSNFMRELLSVYPNLGMGTIADRSGLSRLLRSGPFPCPDSAKVNNNGCSAIREPVYSPVGNSRKNKKPSPEFLLTRAMKGRG